MSLKYLVLNNIGCLYDSGKRNGKQGKSKRELDLWWNGYIFQCRSVKGDSLLELLLTDSSIPFKKISPLFPHFRRKNPQNFPKKAKSRFCVRSAIKCQNRTQVGPESLFLNSNRREREAHTLINHRRKAVEADLESDSEICRAEIVAGEAELKGCRVRIPPLQTAILEIELSSDSSEG